MITPSKEFLKVFKETSGALSVCESIAIMNIASEAPEGGYLELGTFKGKSAISALCGLKNGSFDLVEPQFENEEFVNQVCGNIISFGKGVRVNFIARYSTDVIEDYSHLCYVFVDSGSHQDGLPMQEVQLLEDRVVKGGIIAFHDFDSQFKEVRESYDYLISTGKYVTIPIDWSSIINYVRENGLEKGNSSWHHTEMDFPCFVGAVKRL